MTTPTIKIAHAHSQPGYRWTWSVERDGQVLDASLSDYTYERSSDAAADAAKALFKIARAEGLQAGRSLAYDTYCPAPGETGIVLYVDSVEVGREENFFSGVTAIGRGLPDLLKQLEAQRHD